MNHSSWYQMMDLCLLLCGFWVNLWKLHGLVVEQDPPKSDGDLEGAWEVGSWEWWGQLSLEGEKFRKIKSLILRSFRQRVRMTQNWQHFTNELILHLHDPSSSIYSKSGLNMKRELEGNSNVGTWEGGSKFSTCEVGSRILPCVRSSRTLHST